MATTTTTLSSAVAAADQIINVTSAAGFAVGSLIRIDSEIMVQTAAAVGTVIAVRRGGQMGSIQAAHNNEAPVTVGLVTDYMSPGPTSATNPAQWDRQIVAYGGTSGAITVPTSDTTITLNHTTAMAMTLAAPNAFNDGMEVTILSNTTGAHTVTYTAGFYNDTASSDVATFTAKQGSSMTIIASKGTWTVKALANVTLG
jgi:hypothetical protein